MSTTEPILPPDPHSTPPARRKGQPYGPGLTPGVMVIAACAFLLLMSAGTFTLVQTLRATESELDHWPVARKRLRTSPTVVTPAQAGLGATEEGAIFGDFDTTTPQAPSATRRSDPWLQYFPEFAAGSIEPKMTGEDLNKLLFHTPRTGTWGWALYDPASPFTLTYPLTPEQERMKARIEQYKEAEAAGFPENTDTAQETEQERAQAAAAEAAWEKRRAELAAQAKKEEEALRKREAEAAKKQ